MERTTLPVLTDRTAFGFRRTACACPECTESCRYVPGNLVPDDLIDLYAATAGLTGESVIDVEEFTRRLLAWAEVHLRASPGATCLRVGEDGKSQIFQIPTLVPARRADNRTCHWLTEDGGCAVHDVAPFGCAFFDSHMDRREGDRRSRSGLAAVAGDMAESNGPDAEPGGIYTVVWQHLHAKGLVAPGPGQSRQQMTQARDAAGKPVGDDLRKTILVSAEYERRQAGLPPELFREMLGRALMDKGLKAPPEPGKKEQPFAAGPRVGRNDPCPCGSGKKFKKCHGAQP